MEMCLRISCNYNNLITRKSNGHNVVISHATERDQGRKKKKKAEGIVMDYYLKTLHTSLNAIKRFVNVVRASASRVIRCPMIDFHSNYVANLNGNFIK